MLTLFAAYSNLKIITYKRKGDITHHASFQIPSQNRILLSKLYQDQNIKTF